MCPCRGDSGNGIFFKNTRLVWGGGDSVPVTDDLSTGYQVSHSSHLRRDEVWDFAITGMSSEKCPLPHVQN
jgi:hypothetical protein